jgi:hypothetical protein
MTYRGLLEITAQWAAILTAAIAALAYGRYAYERFQKRRRLENYLKDETESGVDQGKRTVIHLMARLSMTESEVLDAAFRSKHVRPAVSVDWQGRADALLFEYEP